ncbi:Cytochrome c oxidase subunit VIb [Penicillium coprophilum]|uniref:Cytochrome c oxidase subunit VIb n=1 Tax=Penicillium coprophilum TaxID=36646 RepID=UPI002390504C|nr:Cytochrome c oxidase subunit VIb [Penicillium coprophilum]KAJ5163740.1 Cytochrome c oxidase subunit VIb [Penicillium coprophilum]
MVWVPWSSGDSNKNAASDGGRVAPDRTSRARCWEGRDRFFACLDKNDILDGIKDDKKARQKCADEVVEFEAACSQSWVKYFKEKRVMEFNRDKTIERIQKEDAAKVKELKQQGWNSK